MSLEFHSLPLDVRQQARVVYETERIGFQTLAKRFGTNHDTLHVLAAREGWKAFQDGMDDIAEDVEVAIMTQQLPHPAPDQVPPHRATRRGRPMRGRDDAQRALNAKAIEAARRLYRPGQTNMSDLARTLNVGRKVLYNARKLERWDQASPKSDPSVPAVEVLGPGEDPQKTQMRVALAAIRASMTVNQIRQLERYDALLGRYWHWLECYLAPHEHVDVSGMNADEAAEKVAMTQRQALGMLTPTDRDSLTGVVKTLSDALFRSIELKRQVAGLDKVALLRPGMEPGDPATAMDGPELINVDDLSTADLRAVRAGMELLERHRRDRREVPMPPAPDTIDDLLGPEPQVVEPTIPR
jgi:hypothetical protein